MQETENNHRAIGPIDQLVTMRNLPLKGALKDEQLEVLTDAGILIKAGNIHAIGPFDDIQKKARRSKTPVEELEGPVTVLPGLIDAHTHICFAGARAHDYALRASGATYQDIAAAGGGIWDTVQHTREADAATLAALVQKRGERLLRRGVTTVEVKSGYGLTPEHELKMLRAIRQAAPEVPLTFLPTCLPAHIIPRDFDEGGKAYIDWMLNDFFPLVQQEGLSNRADIFVENHAFNEEQARYYLRAVQKLGMDITIHADQFTTGSSRLGVEFGAASVDHLEMTGTREIVALAESSVMPVVLPGASVGLGCNFAPARRLLRAGAGLAIASDWNPGSAPMGDLLTLASILGMFQKLTLAEVLAGITCRAAAALRLDDRGLIENGKLADLTAFPTNDYRDILYLQGQMRPSQVWKAGKLTHKHED